MQKVIDLSLNWMLLYNKVDIEAKVDDIKAVQLDHIDDLKNFTYGSVRELEKNGEKNRSVIENAVANCKQLEQQGTTCKKREW